MYGSTQKHEVSETNPFEEALRAITTQCAAARRCSQGDKALILALAARVAEAQRAAYLAKVRDLLDTRTNRGGVTFEKVVNLIDHQRRSEWTTHQLRDALKDVPAKRLADVTGYLVRCGRFKRLSRGRYLDAAGYYFETSDELPSYDIPRGGDNED